MALIQTIHGNYEGYTKKEVLQAKEASGAQAMLGNPCKKDYKGMVRANNLIPNCPIIPSDVTNARDIFGPDLASVHGKMVHQSLTPVVADYVAVFCQLVEANATVVLAVDVFFCGWDIFADDRVMKDQVCYS
jgi:hypothetical protein